MTKKRKDVRAEVEDLKRELQTMKRMLGELYNMVADMVDEDIDDDGEAMNGHRPNGLSGGGEGGGGYDYYEPPNMNN